ncbi:MAG: aminotransferase class I/II-fold pyridoxal phosphate-dependent enzyme [Firmicutes bacterium]|nr:aminotransferase class I/II-fold pyridoxal phosphate-dependent enzyme [Bacillota bacterium]
MLDQNKTPLFDAIMYYDSKRPAYFRIPGHRYEKGINPRWREVVGDKIFGFDLTETPIVDDLHNASGAIKDAQDLAAELWGADYTHFLVNGSTCGNQVAVITTAVNGEKVCIPRNAHKSALMGLILGGARPVYIAPYIEDEWGLQGGITAEQAEKMFEENPDCKGLMVVSPSYYGITSNIAELARVCHSHGAILMVDEAHGAHCYFSDKLPGGAIAQGADIAVQSIHKVTGSFTQSSMIHVKSELVDKAQLEANLHLVQSTSPSYVLMTSLDMARHYMATEGVMMIDRALELARDARERINSIPGMRCATKEDLEGKAGIYKLDETRLTISAARLGLTGFALKEMLFNDYNVDLELADYRNVLAIVTFANEKEDLDRLVEALADIAKKYESGSPLPPARRLPAQPEFVITPREAYFSKNKRRIAWSDCRGHVMAEYIAPYPPGIPLIYQGERMSDDVWEYLEEVRARKGHIHGPSDVSLETVLVVD